MTAEPRTLSFWLERALLGSFVVLLVAAFFAPRLMQLFGSSGEEIARAQCKEYYDAAIYWWNIRENPPDSLEAMESPLNPEDEDFIRLQDDPWGNVYVLETQGERLLVRSFGPDGKRGTADDIIWAGE